MGKWDEVELFMNEKSQLSDYKKWHQYFWALQTISSLDPSSSSIEEAIKLAVDVLKQDADLEWRVFMHLREGIESEIKVAISLYEQEGYSKENVRDAISLNLNENYMDELMDFADDVEESLEEVKSTAETLIMNGLDEHLDTMF